MFGSKEQEQVNDGLGRASIGRMDRTTTFSRRAYDEKLHVTNGHCKHCGHHKRLETVNFAKCSRCKRKI